MKAQACNINQEVGRVLAGLDIGDRLTCVDFLRQHLGVEAYVEVRTSKDGMLNRLAGELRDKLERDWYLNAERMGDVEQLMRDILERAYDAKAANVVASYKLVDDIRDQERMRQIIAARHRKERAEKLGAEILGGKNERLARRDDFMEGNVMAYRRKRFNEYLKQMEKMYRGDDGNGLAISSMLFMGDIKGAMALYRSLPAETKDANPLMQSAIFIAEAFMTKPQAGTSSVLGVEVGSAFEYESPFTMSAPSPYAH
ncbi:hypothetical protein [Scleromatobacter humisilvae]|uniref:Uncharacterized protein n=1 Tax=Scleromatobacter humisilvae TaxID=2897159 RepID=A0A9X1YLV1_9BURK|nr:hypothetical protein [Scleromatobacter humisilvae]MCK9687265.1 hypothetical protein [Scleromatobacter humisilvae]